MFKTISDAIYKTPWWGMALGGLFTLLLLAVFTVPFNVIRLSESGGSRAEKQAIQREIDHTFGDSALSLAEKVVGAIGARTTDPARKAELDQALRDIAEARKDMFNAELAEKRSLTEANREAKLEAKRATREAINAARAVARDAATASRDAARERIQELKTARKEAQDVQARVGLTDGAAMAAFDKAIVAAEESERTATDALKQLRSNSKPIAIGLATDSAKPTAGADKAATKGSAVAPSGSKSTGPMPEPPNNAGTKSGEDVNVGTKDQRSRGSVSIGFDDKPLIMIEPAGPPAPVAPVAPSAAAAPPAPPLPPELRDEIRRKVTGDFRRVGIGSAMIVTFVPLFLMLLIAKLYIGRSRRSQELALLKTKEAESANVNRQIVEAKLMALQAQVEPHFLYNTLANVQALTEVDPPQANKMTGHLIQYLRASLPKMRENISTVGQEIELVSAYLNILKMRMGARLEFGVDAPEALLALPFPPLMLPSLVENAIKHGLEPQREGGRIDVVAERIGQGDDATIRIMVKDTGRGFSDAPIQVGGGVGLANIRERLLALFGDRAHLTLESNTPKGVVAIIETPSRGATMFSTVAAAPTREEVPKTWRGKTLRMAAKTHSVWAGLVMKLFVGIVAILGVLFIVGMIALATGSMPLVLGETRITGVEGMALGTLALLLGFCVLCIVALIVVAVIYGLGFLLLALAIGIPVIVLIAAFPALSPFALLAFLIYWFWWRKRAKDIVIAPPKA